MAPMKIAQGAVQISLANELESNAAVVVIDAWLGNGQMIKASNLHVVSQQLKNSVSVAVNDQEMFL